MIPEKKKKPKGRPKGYEGCGEWHGIQDCLNCKQPDCTYNSTRLRKGESPKLYATEHKSKRQKAVCTLPEAHFPPGWSRNR